MPLRDCQLKPGLEDHLRRHGFGFIGLGLEDYALPGAQSLEIQALIDAYTVDDAVDWFAAAAIKPWVEATIYQRYSQPKQHSMNQERLDLLLAGEVTSERMAELNAARSWIKAMVDRSNTLEAELRTLDMPALLAITATTGWQETFPL